MDRIRRKVLFIAEAVTLAQVARLRTLCDALPADRFELHFACARFDPLLFERFGGRLWPLRSISPARAERAMRWGLRLYDRATLARYVEEDLRLFEAVQPDLVVGDLRWSLAVSGPIAGVKVAALANAYWSPWVERDGFPLPEHPLVRLLGVELAARHYPLALPAVFRHFARPLDALRERYGLVPLGSLPEVLTWGDLTLYADPPSLFSLRGAPASHRFLGAVQWAPRIALPPLAGAKPLVYVTLGSSGNLSAAHVILRALSALDVEVLLATAGRFAPRDLPANVRSVDYAPGDLAARAASVVVCNGGSSTGYQAVAEGTPVVGLPGNLDQYLAMTAIERAQAGVLVRSGTATVAEVRSAVERGLHDAALRAGARRLAEAMRTQDSGAEFLGALESWP